MDEIAREADFGKATLYYYFTSKEEVFSAIMEKGWKALWEGIEDIVQAASGPRETFLKILSKTVEITLSDNNLYRFLFTAPSAITQLPENHQAWKSYQDRLYGTLRGLLEEGMDKGEFPKLDPELLFRAIGGLFHGLLFLGDGRESVTEQEIDELLTKLLMVSNPGEAR